MGASESAEIRVPLGTFEGESGSPSHVNRLSLLAGAVLRSADLVTPLASESSVAITCPVPERLSEPVSIPWHFNAAKKFSQFLVVAPPFDFCFGGELNPVSESWKRDVHHIIWCREIASTECCEDSSRLHQGEARTR